ncbi:MFS transporter [Peredibacter starrii]|uniref:MFS transporter n=1 Tax=Peredibacter starrii TaxID=28202 RepID=A0AAX4HR39_9BACT|nr:MFS transporter [Peredibacter starrii]WPU65711.1 MFS transporter [Peredibacter starrii]
MTTDFKKLMTARFFFTLAVQMQAIVLGWRMYELTKDALYLGLIGLVEAVPALSLALFAGYIVDRSRPLVVYRRLTLVSLASGLLMLLSQLPYFHVTIDHQVVLLFCSSFLTGCARAFSQPSMFSLVPKIIPRVLLPKSSAWMSSAMQTARMSGPALGGVFYGFLGVSGTAVIICTFLIITITSLYLFDFNPPANEPEKDKSIKEELLSGAKFVFKHPILFPALTLDMVSVLFGGVTALLPIYAAEVLFVGPEGLGILRAAPAIGSFLMSAWLIRGEIKKNAGRKLFSAVAGFGVCILVFAVSRNYILSLLALVCAGAFDGVSMVVRTSAVQLSSPDHMRGRIAAVNSIFIGSSNEIGEFESGVAAKLLGTVPSAIFGGVMCLASVGIISIFSKKLRNLDLEELEKA